MKSRIASVIFGVSALALGATGASGAALFFNKVPVKTSSEATCFRFASDVMRTQNFRNVHSNRLEVAGEKDGAYVSITCVGRGQQPAIAVVMAVSDSVDVAKRVSNAAADGVKRITCIDSPC